MRKDRQAESTRSFARPIPMQQWPRMPATDDWSLVTSSTRPSMAFIRLFSRDFDAQNDSDLVIAETRVFWKPLYDPQVIPIKITPHIHYRFVSETDSSVDFVGSTKDKDVAAADDFV